MKLTVLPNDLRDSTVAERDTHDRAPARSASVPRWRETPVLKRLAVLWEKWKVIARRIGDFQARVLLSIFYFTVLAPFAIGVTLFSDPLRIRPTGGSGWTERPVPTDDAAAQAGRQF